MRDQTPQPTPSASVTIRKLTNDDHEALEILADRDSAEVPGGAVLVAEVEGSILAAISLADGALVADPFSRTSELRSLLELRASQLRRRGSAKPARGFAAKRRSRAALAGSPPGAGGKLLELPRWG